MYAYRFHIVYLATVLCYAGKNSNGELDWIWVCFGFCSFSFYILEEYRCPMVHLWIEVKG